MFSKKTILVSLLTILIFCNCNTLQNVKNELAKGGFVLWYPAESGIEPGQIWYIKDRKKDIKQLKPENLKIIENDAQFQSLKKEVDASISLDTQFSNKLLSQSGEMSALLKAGTVKSVSLNFGVTKIQRIITDDLATMKLKPAYKARLSDVENKKEGYFLIIAVVNTSGLKYVFKCDNTSSLQAKAPDIAKSISADFNLTIISNTEATWDIPNSKVMAIGITPFSGKLTDKKYNEEFIKKSVYESIQKSEKLNIFNFKDIQFK